MTARLRRAARRAALAAFVAAPALGAAARPAAAQTVTAAYVAGCGPGGACNTVNFTVANTTGAALSFDTFTLFTGGAAYVFSPTVPGGTTGSFDAQDDIGPSGGATTLANGGRELFINFVEPGPDFAFFLNAGSSGVIGLAVEGAPALTGRAFTFSAARTDGAQVRGAVAVVPEPGTVALLGAGLLGVAAAARRRRA